MTDLDALLDERLTRAGAEFQARPVPEALVAWPSPRRLGSRRVWLAPAAIAAAVALIVAGISIAAWLGKRHTSPPAKPAPALVLTPDREFAVGPPYDYSLGGPDSGPPPPACAAAGLHATAKTHVSGDGVVGLITITGHGCSLPVDVTSLGLVRADLRGPLNVPLSKGNTTNPVVVRADFAENAGQVRVGFAWSGSYCGPPAKWVGINVGGNKALLITLDGPSPACHSGDTSVLIPGAVGGLNQAVEPAPVSWGSLTAKVVLPPAVTAGEVPLVVELTNHGSKPVSLASPCPEVIVRTQIGGASVGGPLHDLCSRPLTVQPGRPLTLNLGLLNSPDPSNFPQLQLGSGEAVSVTFSIAGIPPATATTRIR